MPRTVVFDELLLVARIPEGLPAARVRAARRALAGPRFRTRLRAALRAAVAADRALAAAGVAVRVDR